MAFLPHKKYASGGKNAARQPHPQEVVSNQWPGPWIPGSVWDARCPGFPHERQGNSLLPWDDSCPSEIFDVLQLICGISSFVNPNDIVNLQNGKKQVLKFSCTM